MRCFANLSPFPLQTPHPTNKQQTNNTQTKQKDDLTRLTALKWLKEFVALAGGALLPWYGDILAAALPGIGHPNREIQQAARECNDALLAARPSGGGTSTGTGVTTGAAAAGGGAGAGGEGGEDGEGEAGAAARMGAAAVLSVVSAELRSEKEPTRLEALRWIHFLLERCVWWGCGCGLRVLLSPPFATLCAKYTFFFNHKHNNHAHTRPPAPSIKNTTATATATRPRCTGSCRRCWTRCSTP